MTRWHEQYAFEEIIMVPGFWTRKPKPMARISYAANHLRDLTSHSLIVSPWRINEFLGRRWVQQLDHMLVASQNQSYGNAVRKRAAYLDAQRALSVLTK